MTTDNIGLDVHVLSIPERKTVTLPRCLDSIEAAIAKSPFPVAVHVVEAERGNTIITARKEAYALGEYNYVMSVDDDDWIEPESFEKLEEHMLNNTPAIYAAAWRVYPDKKEEFNRPGFFRVFRRDVADTFTDPHNPGKGDAYRFIAEAAKAGEAAWISDKLYYHTEDTSTLTHTLKHYGEERLAEMRKLPRTKVAWTKYTGDPSQWRG